MTYSICNDQVLERYCPVLAKNVLMQITESGTNAERQTIIKCQNINQCKNCYGDCTNKFIQNYFK